MNDTTEEDEEESGLVGKKSLNAFSEQPLSPIVLNIGNASYCAILYS